MILYNMNADDSAVLETPLLLEWALVSKVEGINTYYEGAVGPGPIGCLIFSTG